jgi:hypothetical protein
MPAKGLIYINCDHRIRYLKAKDEEGAPLNNGTCNFTLTAQDGGTVVTSGTVPYITGSAGNYKQTIDRTVTATLVENAFYFLRVVFSCNGWDDDQTIELKAVRR